MTTILNNTPVFEINAIRNLSVPDSPSCIKADIPISPERHLNAHELSPFAVSKISFSSCNKLSQKVYYPDIWKHLRNKYEPDLWIWLGDNAYSDGEDMNYKRRKYSEAREDDYYKKYGPIGLPKIPVTGIWDDHDFSSNDLGMEYTCPEMSQNEFCVHFNISSSDVRHPDYMPIEGRQSGIYSSLVLPAPFPYNKNPDVAGVHIINLDTRSQRSILNENRGDCFSHGGGHHNSDFLRDEQWDWLSRELFQIKSEITIISSSVQVLTPSDSARLEKLCSYDGPDGTFMQYIHDLGEDINWMGGEELYVEKWADIPIARAKLLKMVQMSINMGMTKAVIFISGNAHFGDIMAKRMPEHSKWGASQTLYEVVSSGIGQNPRYKKYPNAVRVRVRTCDTKGDENYFKECKFPFLRNGKLHDECILDETDPERRHYCYYEIDDGEVGDDDSWGYCIPEDEEVVPRSDQKVTNLGEQLVDTCAQNHHHICTAHNMYGGISIDWEKGKAELSNFVPQMSEKAISSVTVHFDPEWKKATASPTLSPTMPPVLPPIRTTELSRKPIIFSNPAPAPSNEDKPWVLDILDLEEKFETNSSDKNISIIGIDIQKQGPRPVIQGSLDNNTESNKPQPPQYRPEPGMPAEFILIGMNLVLVGLFMGLYVISMSFIRKYNDEPRIVK